MDMRPLGRSGLSVPKVIFGGNVFGWTVDAAAAPALLDAMVAEGLNAIDTADVYSRWVPGNHGGESETIIGNWLKARGGRDRVTILTKVGMEIGPGQQGLSRRWITQAVEASLKRLQTDYIDLYQAHRDDAATPLEETLETFAGLIKSGKVRAIGASNYTAPRLREALAVSARLGLPRFETLQPHYNMVERQGFEAELAGVCQREGIGVIPYYALASGFLTGKYRSSADLGKSPRGARMADLLNPRGMRILAALDEVAAAVHANPAQVALAWLASKPTVVAPIASATNRAQLADLVAAARLELDATAMRKLDEASAAAVAAEV